MRHFTSETDIVSSQPIMNRLGEAIEADDESLSFTIRVVRAVQSGASGSGSPQYTVVAQGSVHLWVMIEDACSILRQVLYTLIFHVVVIPFFH
jgi:hypothetical protein